MAQGFQNIFRIPELRNRVLITLFLLAVYRVGVHIPTPGIDVAALEEFFKGAQGTIFGFFDMFSGGGLRNLSVFALGIMPYISASIILQLLTVVVPYLERLAKEGEAGRKKITQYTRYGTVVLAAFQAFAISFGLEQMTSPSGVPVVPPSVAGWGFRLMTMITLTAGTAFIMWLGEQITERGIGNGISLIIFAGIVARMPTALIESIGTVGEAGIPPLVFVLIIAVMVLVVAWVVFMERGQRRIPVQYAKRVIGRRMYGGSSTHLPLRINTSGVIPPIFASSILMFPMTIASFIPKKLLDDYTWLNTIVQSFGPTEIVYNVLYVVMIIFFCYFYTAVTFNPVDVSDNMKRYGGFVPGIRPGKPTSEYIDKVLTRITLVGALYVSAVCVLPTILIANFNIPFYFGGTALLIVVGVALDTVQQIETHMLTRHYEGFLKRGKLKGRR